MLTPGGEVARPDDPSGFRWQAASASDDAMTEARSGESLPEASGAGLELAMPAMISTTTTAPAVTYGHFRRFRRTPIGQEIPARARPAHPQPPPIINARHLQFLESGAHSWASMICSDMDVHPK